MHTEITVSVIRDDIYQQVPIEDLTEHELQDVLKRATPTQLRAYCSLLVRSIREHINRQNAAPLAKELAEHVKKGKKR